jgi:hypothetical protein
MQEKIGIMPGPCDVRPLLPASTGRGEDAEEVVRK